MTGRGAAEGDPRLRAGTRVALDGLGGLFDGVHDVVRIWHSYEGESGYRMSFQTERAGVDL